MSQSTPPPSEVFPAKCHLLCLPQELRQQIYSLALPKPRILRIALDIETRQAQLIGPFSRIPLLLHICQDTRQFALLRFSLGFSADPIPLSNHGFENDDEDEEVEAEREDIMDDDDYEQYRLTIRRIRDQRNQRAPGENSRTFYWNPAIDTIYLISPSIYYQDHFPFLQDYKPESASLDDRFSTLPQLFPAVQNIAVKCTAASMRQHFDILPQHGVTYTHPSDRWVLKMLQQLPNLKSLDLLIEPNGRFLGQSPRSKHYALNSELTSPPTSIVLAAPYDDVKVQGFNMTAVEIEDAVRARMKAFDSKWEALDVSLSVIVIKKFKDSGWCLGSTKNQEWWSVYGWYIYAGSSHSALQLAGAEAARD